MLRKLFEWFFKLFRDKKSPKTDIDEFYKFEFIDDVPDEPKFRTIYLVGQENHFWQFVMLCPCGCNSLLYMNLMEEIEPYWTFKIHENKITFNPSIDRIVGCKSHFFIRESKIIWA